MVDSGIDLVCELLCTAPALPIVNHKSSFSSTLALRTALRALGCGFYAELSLLNSWAATPIA